LSACFLSIPQALPIDHAFVQFGGYVLTFFFKIHSGGCSNCVDRA
jgi:hypothetical protein